MLKDFVFPSGDFSSEEAFVGDFWDQKWDGSADNLALRRRQMQQRETYHQLNEFIARRPNARVLDCGCGMGEWTLQLVADGVETIGVDIASKRIQLLQDRFGAATFRLGSFLNADFPDQSFDVVFNWGGAEHFEAGLQLAFREAYRLLKPGGYFLASTPAHNFRHMLRGFSTPNAEQCHPDRRFYQYRLTRSEFHAELAAAGFDVERVKLIDRREGAMRWVSAYVSAGKLRNGLALIAGRTLPAWLLGHMIIGVGRKPEP